MFPFFLLVSCFKCCFSGDETDPCILELDCKDGCVNVTKDGGKGTSRNCWNKNDIQKDGCNKYGNEEICICYAELCNLGPSESDIDATGKSDVPGVSTISEKDEINTSTGIFESTKKENDVTQAIMESTQSTKSHRDKFMSKGTNCTSKSLFLLILCAIISIYSFIDGIA